MYIAVVTNQDPTISRAPEGAVSGFIDTDKDVAIAKALKASASWGQRLGKTYRVLVGELTEEAHTLQWFKVEAFNG